MMSALLMVALLQAAPPPMTAADEQFVAEARAASEPFKDRNAAIRAGYRKLGPDTPDMGEHWINPIMIVEARYDVKRPAMLTYKTVNGKPILTGVGYALAMRENEEPPPTGVSGHWHEHSAQVPLELAAGHHKSAHGKARVVVMHAWVWVANPNGVFADANPALRAPGFNLQ